MTKRRSIPKQKKIGSYSRKMRAGHNPIKHTDYPPNTGAKLCA